MSEKTLPRSSDPIPSVAQRRHYRITLRGQIDQRWMAAFDPISVACSTGATTMDVLADQAWLRFILNRLWDLNCDISMVVEADAPVVRNGV